MGGRVLSILFLLCLIPNVVWACSYCSGKDLPKPVGSTNPTWDGPKSYQPPGFVVQGAAGVPNSNLGKLTDGYLDSVGKDYPVEPDQGARSNDNDITVTDPGEVYNRSGQ